MINKTQFNCGINPFSDYGYGLTVDFDSLKEQMTDEGMDCDYTVVEGTGLVPEGGGDKPTTTDNYLTFIGLESNCSIQLRSNGLPDPIELETSVDGGKTWEPYTVGDTITLTNVGNSVKFRGNNNHFSKNSYNFYYFSYNLCMCVGDVTSLLDKNGGDVELTPYCFCGLFSGYGNRGIAPTSSKRTLVLAPNLPSTSLAEGCYISMFESCTYLIKPPLLPSEDLADYCYSCMFQRCTSLETPPSLPATTLKKYCYADMFYGCTSLTTAPALPATVMAEGCYGSNNLDDNITDGWYEIAGGGMFGNCTSLNAVPTLNIQTTAPYCFGYMFNGCTSLTSPGLLTLNNISKGICIGMYRGCTGITGSANIYISAPLSEACFAYMFMGCTSLGSPINLPTTNLAPKCYMGMFKGCTSLDYAPELPSTTLQPHCYAGMFSGCTRLSIAPNLPATTLVEGCYGDSQVIMPGVSANRGMFENCTNLRSIYVGFTEFVEGTTTGWLANVSETGTFRWNGSVEPERGINTVPENWTISN